MGLALQMFLAAITLLCLLVVSVSAETSEVTCGSVIKLLHERTKFRLHSHEVTYGSGSGQQSVTGFQSGDDANSYWVVRSALGAPACQQGDPIPNGTKLRLQHQKTRRWLHSHLHASPLSNNLEVSCYGDDKTSDTGDNWKLEIEGKGTVWKKDQRIRFQHVDTQSYLQSHDKKYGRPIAGQLEVCGYQKKNSDNIWVATEGVYFPPPKSAQQLDVGDI